MIWSRVASSVSIFPPDDRAVVFVCESMLALVVVLIVALDWPFRGEISITPNAFVMTQRSWADLAFEKK